MCMAVIILISVVKYEYAVLTEKNGFPVPSFLAHSFGL